MKKNSIYFFLFILFINIVFSGCNTSSSEHMYTNKKLGIQFKVPETWDKNYKKVHIKEKDSYEHIVFESRYKDQNVILLELWVLDKNSWIKNKDFRKLNYLGSRNENIYAYSRPKFKSIMENLGGDIGMLEPSIEKRLKDMYISPEELRERFIVE